MKAIFPIQRIFVFSIFLITASGISFAQKIESTPILGAGRIVMYTDFKGLIGSKEFRGNVRSAVVKYNYNLLVYENGKKLMKKDMEIAYNDNKYVPIDYFIKDGKIVAYFIAGNKTSDKVMLCLQEFDTELKQIGNAIEIAELPRAVDPTKLLNNKSGGMFKDNLVKEQDLNVKYDKNSGTVLFSYSLQLVKEQNVSYCKIILIDNSYTILNEYDYQASSGENYVQAIPQQIFENNDAMISISEGIKEMDKDNYRETFNISKQAEIYISANGDKTKELELMPDKSRITNSTVSENLSKNGDVIYGIVSSEYDKIDKTQIANIALYRYNAKSEKIDRKSYEYDIQDVFINYRVLNASSYYLRKIFNLKDGSILLWLTATGNSEGYKRDYGHIFIKIDQNNQLVWMKGLRKETTSYAEYAGSLDYFDDNGDFNLVFNFNPKRIQNNQLDTPFDGSVNTSQKSFVNLGSIPFVATLNISTGDLTIKKMEIENTQVGAILITDCEKLNDEGKYRVHMMINKKVQFVDIDFNGK
jgi:hypothetical protein